MEYGQHKTFVSVRGIPQPAMELYVDLVCPAGIRWSKGKLLLYLALLLVYFSGRARGVTNVSSNPSEVSALLAIKESISEDPLGVLHSWNASHTSPCSWTGVMCKHSKVHTLNISGYDVSGSLSPRVGELVNLVRLDVGVNQLSGNIPPELGKCKLLQYLDLSQNSFSGTIPSELQNLKFLNYLSLYTNNISGSIPPGIFELSKLETIYLNTNNLSGELIVPSSSNSSCSLSILYLYENSLTGHIPGELSRCSNLTELVLSYNSFDGPIPSELGNLHKLESLSLGVNFLRGVIPKPIGKCSLTNLDISSNELTGEIPKELNNCSNLNTISLSANNLFGVIPALPSSLIYVDFSNNSLSGSIPVELFESTGLQHLGLLQNNLNGSIPPEIGKLVSLEILWLSQNNLTGSIPREVGNMTMLKELLLSGNGLTGEVPPDLANLANLEKLYLDENGFQGDLPADLGRYNNLTEIEINSNRFTGQIPRSLCSSGQLSKVLMWNNLFEGGLHYVAKCSTIKRLRLNNNRLNETIPQEFGGNTELEYLDLGYNYLQGPIPKELGQCRNLTFIDVSRNKLSGTIPDELGNLTKLAVFIAAENRLSGFIPNSLTGCRNLLKLDLSDNHFQGSLPSNNFISRLSELTSLRLSRNNFSGTIPATFFGSSSSLLELQLGENHLEGSIPSSIGELQFLTIDLNLSWNSLSGSIPLELGSLSRLQSLDLSHNELTGEVPPQLSNMVSLVSANLSFNHLVGSLPRGPWTQLRESSFAGNTALCMFTNDSSTCEGSNGSLPSSPRRRTGLVLGITLGLVGALLIVIIFSIWRVVSRQRQHENVPLAESIKLFVDQGQGKGSTSLRAISRALTMLSEENIIGRGAHGVVYKVAVSDGQVFAVKKLNASRNSKQQMEAFQSFEREIETAGKFRHRNLVKILSYRSDEETSMIVYEYMPKGSLNHALYRTEESLSWKFRLKVALGAAQGLSYLHHDCVPMVIHRDVKSSNVLLDENMEGKISDFGIAKLVDEDIRTMSAVVGTYGYIAPEYCYTMRVSEKVDIYAFGVVLLELVTRKSPYDSSFGDGVDLTSWVRSELQRTGSMNAVVDPFLLESEADVEEVLNMVKVALICTSTEPSERPSMRQVVEMLMEIGREKRFKS